ncbi:MULTISPECIES: maleylpyruvate isomerase family mycothiol-dependent enzyme [unclassified Streptomyces]|uniref:maleylpyruvate isomerase family mycothiol-dependent enzyme n=1 Tax=unclassified Streptomyces TaxID=2593676 RepID=UPI00380DF2A1
MTEIPEFPALLRLIDERSAAFRAAVAAAPSLDAQVPTCPEWTLRDLVEHLGGVHRRWAANVAAGPADGPSGTVPEAPKDPEALLAWSAESTEELLGTLREFGPDRACWTWWGGSQSPQTSGAVARHQVQEASVHTYDAQLTLGASQARALPEEAALDGVDEFLSTCCAGPDPWPHAPAVVDYHATEGRSWRLTLSADGAHATRVPADAPGADASLRGTAGELVLVLYGRIPVGSLEVDGDGNLFDLLLAWDPSA